ncbi:MAG: hypothetical protein QM741_14520 [Rudaea sp.]|uniref:DUF7064 domain-containing protein n=1 Tax=Rudaea sp. TaxID=2136325 RepID=UPI0039E3E7A1
MPTITRSFADFPAEHAYRHKLKPEGRESLAHMLVFPEQGVTGFIYPTVRANGHAKGRASLFGPALKEPVHEEVEQYVPDTMGFDDWRTGPLHMQVIEPHKKVRLAWNGERIRFDGLYEALHPPYAFSSHPLGNPPYYGDDRTEQHGRVSAELAIDGRRQKVSGYLIRDHSWGPRVWGLNQHYKWFHATSERCSIHFFEMLSFGRCQLRGFLFRDGVMRHLAGVEYDFGYDDTMMQTWIKAKVTDTDGRSAVVDGKALGTVQLEFDPMIYLNEAGLALTIDGEPGTGWCEFCWNRNYLEFARGYVSRYG